jgi:glyoxylate/hydroxypyruvate reductase A
MMVNIYIDPGVKDVEVFTEVLVEDNIGFNVFSSLDNIHPENIDIAIIWLNIPNCLSDFVNLKLLLISGSGIDHLLNKNILPKVPTVRLVDEKLKNNVADYVLNAVNEYREAVFIQQASNITVGLMGVGLVGTANYYKLKDAGYSVNCWVRSNKNREVDNVFVGNSQIVDFVKKCNVLVCQLPLTEETVGILNKKIFDLMPKNGYIINVGRGAHLNEKDLILAIEKGKVKGACLDVFKIEPLPEDSFLRSQSGIKLTPHIAGGIFPKEQAKYAKDVVLNFLKQHKLKGVVDYKLGY